MEQSETEVEGCCGFVTEWGPCLQPGEGLCAVHRDGFRVDRYYERKVVSGLLEPVEAYASESQLRALIEGRRHRDGRSLDSWVPD